MAWRSRPAAFFAVRSPGAASTAWTSTRSPSNWPAWRSGSTRSCPACRCRSWPTAWYRVTAGWHRYAGRGSSSTRPGSHARAGSLFRGDHRVPGRAEPLSGGCRRGGEDDTDIEASRAAQDEALAAVKPARQLFDLLVAARLGRTTVPIDSARLQSRNTGGPDRRRVGRGPGCRAFPRRIPRSVLATRPGFDCVLGNPPWEEATVEELGFWALRFPGLKGMARQSRGPSWRASGIAARLGGRV